MTKMTNPAADDDLASALQQAAQRILSGLRRVPRAYTERTVELPERVAGGVRWEKVTRVRVGVAALHAERVALSDEAVSIGRAILGRLDVPDLVKGAGPVRSTDEETCGHRVITRLIDAVCIGRTRVPPSSVAALGPLCESFAEQLREGRVEVEWMVPLPGVGFPAGRKGLKLDERVELRTLSREDLREVWELEKRLLGAVFGGLPMRTSLGLSVWERQRPGCVADDGAEAASVFRRLQTALLLWSDVAVPDTIVLRRARRPSPFSASGGEGTLQYAHAGRYTVTEVLPATVRKSFTLVSSCEPQVWNSIACDRALNSALRTDGVDAMVDAWVGLESLLLKDDERTELAYRMSLRAACLAGAPDFAAFKRAFSKAYDARSRCVHGARLKGPGDLSKHLDWSVSLLRKLVRRTLEDGGLFDLSALEREMVGG